MKTNIFASLGFCLVAPAAVVPPAINYPPKDQTVIVYQQAAFGVIASGTPPLAYHWRKDGLAIVGATNDQIVLRQSQFSDVGRYSVVVSNAEGSITSTEATLTINPPTAGDMDFSFEWGGSTPPADTLAVQPDGKVLIAGGFTTVYRAARKGIARLNLDGSVDHTFMNGVMGVDGYVRAVALQSDGKIVIGGYFSAGNGEVRDAVARLNRDGSVDENFAPEAPGPNNEVSSLVEQSDGRLLIGGGFGVARLKADGTLDSGFESVISNELCWVNSIAAQPDGKLLVGGNFKTVTSPTRYSLVRLNSDGTLDSTFQSKRYTGPDVFAIALQSDGKIVVGGAPGVSTVSLTAIARLNQDGSLDPSFVTGLSDPQNIVSSIAVQPDGKILIGGGFSHDAVTRSGLARLNPNGSWDTTFQYDYSSTSVVALQSDGGIIVSGLNETTHTSILRLHPDMSLDTTFKSEPWGSEPAGVNRHAFVGAIAVQSDGKALIGGGFSSINGATHTNIARLNVDGTTDESFTGSSSRLVRSIALQRDGRVLIGSPFPAFDGTIGGLFRLASDGTMDKSFVVRISIADDSDPAGEVDCLAIQSDEKILVGGFFDRVNGAIRNGLARLNPDGTLDEKFDAALSGVVRGNRAAVTSVAIQPDGRILIAGSFVAVNGEKRDTIARLHSDGTLDRSFQTNLGDSDRVVSVAVQPDGTILSTGGFVRGDPETRFPVARLNPDGSFDTAFQTAVAQTGICCASTDGKIIVGGIPGRTNSMNIISVARLNTNGTLDPNFRAPAVTGIFDLGSDFFLDVALQSDGKILIGGFFRTVNGLPTPGIARLWGNGEVPPRFRSVNHNAGHVSLSWEAIPNRKYRVQFKDSLSAVDWTDLPGDISTTKGLGSKTDFAVDTLKQRVYRIVLLP